MFIPRCFVLSYPKKTLFLTFSFVSFDYGMKFVFIPIDNCVSLSAFVFESVELKQDVKTANDILTYERMKIHMELCLMLKGKVCRNLS